MTLFVPLLLLTLPIISNCLPLSHQKSQSTFPSYENELTDQVCGRNTIPGKVPFYASIEVDHPTLYYKKCGGVLIANRWVLTAVHCTSSVLGPIQVVLGDEWNNKTIGVERSYIHPNFSLETSMNDIALLLLKESVQFNRNIQPICLPEPGEDETFYGHNGTDAGWEKLNLEERKLPSNRQITSLSIIKFDGCGALYAKIAFNKSVLTESFICAGYPKDVKAVFFPGPGSPLMVNVENHWILAGISMGNIDWVEPFLPRIYLRVGFYLDWIKKTVY